jgi:adenylate cyclase
LERGIELTKRLPEESERVEAELALVFSLAGARQDAFGYGHKDTGRTWARARALCEAAGSPVRLGEALRGLMVDHWARSEVDAAMECGAQLLAITRQTGDDVLLAKYKGTRAQVRFLQGRFRESLEDCEAAAAIPSALVVDDIYPVFSSLALSFLGYLDQGAARIEEYVEQTRAALSFTLAQSLLFASLGYVLRREWETCARHARECIEVSERHGFPLQRGVSKLVHALAVADSRGEDTLAEATEGLGGVADGGLRASAPCFLWMLGRIHQESDRQADALSAAESGLEVSAQGKQPFWDAELLRLKGELLLSNDEAEAETLFRRALELARGQEAKTLELRAATSLARLWQRQGKPAEARDLLRPVYHWFTEGFDTGDLKDAKALLEELA